MGNSIHVKIILSDENVAKLNQVVNSQANSQQPFMPTTDMVIKTDRQWYIFYN